jgi:hypothetical protein
MLRAICIILALAFLALGLLGITDIVPILKTDSVFVNIGEVVLGGLGLLAGMFTRERRENYHQQERANELQSKANDQQRKENYVQQKAENEQQRKENNQQRSENEQQRKENDRHS